MKYLMGGEAEAPEILDGIQDVYSSLRRGHKGMEVSFDNDRG